MFLTEPIKKIKGLFNSYKNEQVVPADEYNANITCLQQAIEHNGVVLDEHAKAIEGIIAETLPVGSIQTDFIADEAITLPKLSPDIKDQMLLSPENISNYFQDFLLQQHKSNPDIRGVFMNGAVQAINKTLTRQTSYTKTVSHGSDEYLVVPDPDRGSYYTMEIPYANQATPETYEIAVPTTHPQYGAVKGFGFAWVTRYTLDQAYDINTATDELTIQWDYVYETGSIYSQGGGSCEIYFKDANDATIATLPVTTLKSYQTSQGYKRRVIGVNITQMSAEIFKNVSMIEIKTRCSDKLYDSGLYTPKDGIQPTLSVNMRFGAGTTEYVQHETDIPVTNNLNYVAVGAYIKAATPVDFNTYKLNLAPYCVGVCPKQPAPGFESQVIAYINETADSNYSATLINSSTNHYYIRHNFQAPLIISAKIKENKPDDLHPDFTAGEYYSWPLHFTNNTYITYSTLEDTIQALKDYFSYYIEDITYTEYNLGTSNLRLKFNTTVNNVTIESVSVAKYSGFVKPGLV